MSELWKLGIAEARAGLAKGDFSSVELTQAVIDRVHARDGARSLRRTGGA